jgi:hypothetical protein
VQDIGQDGAAFPGYDDLRIAQGAPQGTAAQPAHEIAVLAAGNDAYSHSSSHAGNGLGAIVRLDNDVERVFHLSLMQGEI